MVALDLPRATAFPFEESLLVLRRDSEQLFLLNSTARAIWEQLSKGSRIADITSNFSSLYGLSANAARQDIDATLSEWQVQGLLGEITEPAPLHAFEKTSAAASQSAAAPGFMERAGSITHRYSFLGKNFSIGYSSHELAMTIHRRFDHLSSSADDNAGTAYNVFDLQGEYVLEANGKEIEREKLIEEIQQLLTFEIMKLVNHDLDWLATVHAGVVADNEGCAIFSAPSGCGKSTLTAALIHDGFHYFSDDFAFLDTGSLQVAASPMCLGIREKSWPILRTRCPGLETLPIYQMDGQGYRFMPPPKQNPYPSLPVKCLILPYYGSKSSTGLSPLPATKALEELIRAELWMPPDPDKIGVFLNWLLQIPCYELHFTSLDQAVSSIRKVVAHETV
jgi:Coenzyme PQQ synthesis protein D (PqqD)